MKEFDFVINEELFKKIDNLKEKKGKYFSVIVRDIILLTLPLLKKKLLFEKRRDKDYRFIKASHRIRLYIPEQVYNELKLVHDQINSFSIAILIRELLEVYFAGIEIDGEEKFTKKIEELKKEMEGLRRDKAVVVKIDSKDIPGKSEQDDYFLLKLSLKFYLKEIKFL
ncbi:MAG TPA: hypothetical protein PLE45_07330 [Spirochaetota bacterium]|nr:hypothetical protein [Spirochaetota bacterium]HOL57057.1 hypothetical protein [Spirochaetota bacterium]HPP04327.1 hypothetical protein [Spirochaetota bacterium]